jgi:hypothetical protein
MEKEKYLQTQMTLFAIGRAVHEMALSEFLAQIGSAETISPVLDPTLYRKAKDNLDAIKALAEALVPFKAQFEKMYIEMMKNAVAAKAEVAKDAN